MYIHLEVVSIRDAQYSRFRSQVFEHDRPNSNTWQTRDDETVDRETPTDAAHRGAPTNVYKSSPQYPSVVVS